MADFADIEPDDSWDADDVIAPEQVARRLHELRDFIDVLAGATPVRFDEAHTDYRNRLEAIAVAIVEDYNFDREQSAESLAERIHAARRIHDPALLIWGRLPESHRDLATAIAAALIAWLRREGRV